MFADHIEGMDNVEKWLVWMSNRGRTEQTVYTYRSVMRHVLTVLDAAGLSTDPMRMGEMEIRYIAGEDGKESSRRLRVQVMCGYIEWATGVDPSKDLSILWNEDEKGRCFITPEQFRKLWQMADPEERVILSLGAYMGLRRSEITGLCISDIDLTHDRLTVCGKGHGNGKRAVLHIPDVVRRSIREYMEVRPRTTIDVLLVETARGRLRAMTDQSLYERVKALGESVGVEVTPHALRRLFATSLRESDVDLDDIRTLMRHRRIETTLDCYIRPNPDRLDRIMESLTI